MNFAPRLGLCLIAISLSSFRAACAQDAAATVYSDQEFLSRWSDLKVGVTLDRKPFHGPFANQPVSLHLENLPTHRWVRVTFDLYIIGSWDGSSPVWGPDLWSMSVRGGQRLVSATFCAWGYAGNDEQSFPDDYRHAIHPAWTGGTRQPVIDLKGDERPPQSGVYRVEALFPHADDSLVVDFAGAYDDAPTEPQLWSLGKFSVQTLTTETLTEEAALPALWEELADVDSVRANAALWRFIGAGEKASRFINDRVAEISEASVLSTADNLRLHRAHRIVRIVGAAGSSDLCFRMDHLSNEYAEKYDDR